MYVATSLKENMANLNFQQPPRSMTSTSMTGRNSNFGGTAMSGHVTPTSGMFQSGGTSFSQPQQSQLSPNRNVQLSIGSATSNGGRPVFNQRAFVERRNGGVGGGLGSSQMVNIGNFMQAARSVGGVSGGGYGASVIGSLGNGGAGPLNNFHNVFGGGGDAPALLDPSEFPSLTNVRGQNEQALPHTNALQPPGSKPYGNFFTSFGMVKQPISEQSEFTMSNEDFPALPGTTQNSDGTINTSTVDNIMDGTDKPIGTVSGTNNNNNNNNGLGAVGSSVPGNSGDMVMSGSANLMNNSLSNVGLQGTSVSNNINTNNSGSSTTAMNSLSMGAKNILSVTTNSVGGSSGMLTRSSNNNSMNANTSGAVAMLNAIGAMTGSNRCIGDSSHSSTMSKNDFMMEGMTGNESKLLRVGVQTNTDGKVTNIPSSMVNNQFGMVGLLTFIRAAETDQNLVTLALGTDLTGLGLNLNSQESLHPTFAGPFSDHPCRAQDVEYSVPNEYLINFAIRDKLATPVLKKLQDDLLFFLFYTNIGDIMQLMAAAELHSRDWRFHTEEKIWITRIPGINQYEKNGSTERGTFYYFDAQSWKRLSKDFHIDAEKLDKCPNINSFGQHV